MDAMQCVYCETNMRRLFGLVTVSRLVSMTFEILEYNLQYNNTYAI